MQRSDRRRYTRALQSRIASINTICEISGAAGLSCGVIHDGERIFTHHFGFRNVEGEAPCDDDTIYAVGSLTKAFTATACAIAVEEGKLDWTTPIKKQLPGFKFSDDCINDDLNLEDILCQRSGLANPIGVWLGKNNEILLENDQLTQTCNNLPMMDNFRTGFRYNNLLYSLAGQLVGRAYSDNNLPTGYMNMLHDKIFKPLGLTRTSFDVDPLESNVAKGYTTLDNGQLHELAYPGLNSEAGGVLAPCGGIRSSLKDMLTWTDELITSAQDRKPLKSRKEFSNIIIDSSCNQHKPSSILEMLRPAFCLGRAKRPARKAAPLYDNGIPLRGEKGNCDNVVLQKSSLLFAPRNAAMASFALDQESLSETSYAFGWCRQSTPTKFSLFSKNRSLIPDEIPLIGAGNSSVLTLPHIGSLPGFASIAILIPELRCSIVVLANAETLGDVTDWVSQLLLEAIVTPHSRTDFEDLARKAAREDQNFFKKTIMCPYQKEKRINEPSGSPDDFIGTYSALGGSFKLVVEVKPNLQHEQNSSSQLVLKVAGKESQSYDLSYYDLDSWGFLPDINDLKLEAIPYQDWESFILRFKRNNGKVCGVTWKLDDGMENTFFERNGP
ncbi:hypothetical protein TWF730_008540 [Orbilia blumenaviensis]|uniref:Beta-lactamase-related domain-containing protein n=1 Tax=Orbilia blumenaviensis TaxID=1796055 RepID=A0AAV9V3F7_9PEZI